MKELQILAQQGGIALQQLQAIQGTNLTNIFHNNNNNNNSSSSQNRNNNGQFKY